MISSSHLLPRASAAAGFAIALSTLLGACDGKTQSERCDEMAEYLEGRASILGRDCLVDDDCRVVFVRPDQPIAANSQPDDPALARTVAEYRAQCEPLSRAVGSLVAVCIERVIDVPNPDNISETITENIGQACVLRGEFTVPDAGGPVDAGADADAGPDAACDCTTSSQCGVGAVCHACVCVADTLCGQACVAADTCGVTSTLGLGADAANCADACERSIADNPGVYQPFVACLRSSACERIEECQAILP